MPQLLVYRVIAKVDFAVRNSVGLKTRQVMISWSRFWASHEPLPAIALGNMMRTAIAGLSAVILAISMPGVPASQPFSLTINALHKRVLSGDQVALTITLTNNSDSEITIVDIDSWCDYTLEVRDAQGQLVPETADKRATKCVPWPPVAARCIIRTLKPHESFDDLMYVGQAYEVGRPGDYFIHAMREIPKELGKGTVKSNLAVITVSE